MIIINYLSILFWFAILILPFLDILDSWFYYKNADTLFLHLTCNGLFDIFNASLLFDLDYS